MHIGVLFHHLVGGAISEAIALKFGILTDLDCIVNFVKFSDDRIKGWGLASSQLSGFCLHLRSHP